MHDNRGDSIFPYKQVMHVVFTNTCIFSIPLKRKILPGLLITRGYSNLTSQNAKCAGQLSVITLSRDMSNYVNTEVESNQLSTCVALHFAVCKTKIQCNVKKILATKYVNGQNMQTI